MSSGEFRPLPGMSDIAAPEIRLWQHVETTARGLFALYGVDEIRTPVVERESVFTRAIGEGTDVVGKEMYAFDDRGGRRLALRPEGTAGVIRALCGLGAEAAGARVYYIGPMFRAERPQAGRKRQFHQIGVEWLGPPSPRTDAECIAMQLHLLDAWGLKDAELRVHTRGVAADQDDVRAGLVGALTPHLDALCEDCRRRLTTHPLRILDCKQPSCRERVETIPHITSFMDDASRAYLNDVMDCLAHLHVPAQVDPRLVRGLDYYEHTVWEITHAALGAQDALAGGGRYRIAMDGRVVEGVGFAVGMERVLTAIQAAGRSSEATVPGLTLWLVSIGSKAESENLALAQELRRNGIACGLDTTGRGVKSQMKAAHRMGIPWVVIRGDDELASGTCKLKNMADGTESTIPSSELSVRFNPAGR